MKVPPARAAEILAAVTVLLCRLLVAPLAEAWRDWIVLLSAYWIFCAAVPPRSRFWLPVTLALMGFLSAVYFAGHGPHAIRILGFAP